MLQLGNLLHSDFFFFFSFHAKHDPQAILQFPASLGGLTMALLTLG